MVGPPQSGVTLYKFKYFFVKDGEVTQQLKRHSTISKDTHLFPRTHGRLQACVPPEPEYPRPLNSVDT